jgi:hypothetical protein
MRWLRLVAFALSLVLIAEAGCTAEDKRQWREALKDARGENMEMGSHDQPKPISP